MKRLLKNGLKNIFVLSGILIASNGYAENRLTVKVSNCESTELYDTLELSLKHYSKVLAEPTTQNLRCMVPPYANSYVPLDILVKNMSVFDNCSIEYKSSFDDTHVLGYHSYIVYTFNCTKDIINHCESLKTYLFDSEGTQCQYPVKDKNEVIEFTF